MSRLDLQSAVGSKCDGLIGQLSESIDAEFLTTFKNASGRVYSNYAVGFNNVDIPAATALGIAIGNTPGVLTEATAELAAGLTLAAARRLVEADTYTRTGQFTGWGMRLFLGDLLHRKTLGVVGVGRIGSAYARMLAQGHRMNLVYLSRTPKPGLEREFSSYNRFLGENGEAPVQVRRAGSIEELLQRADVVGLFPSLNDSTWHLVTGERLRMMKPNAILVNASRGPVVDETALVEHCRTHREFRAALDVYEREPAIEPGLADLPNVLLMPHIGSGTGWTREAMGVIAACNVTGVLQEYPVWSGSDMNTFLTEAPPQACPSIVNAADLHFERSR
jgi:hydroxypyruvate reductase 1